MKHLRQRDTLLEELDFSIALLNENPLPLSPEQRLIIALIDRAIKDSHCSAAHIRIDAIRWLRSREIYPYSFRWCANELGYDFYDAMEIIENGRNFKLYRPRDDSN